MALFGKSTREDINLIASERKTQLAIWQKEASAAAEIVATKTKLTKIKTLKASQPELEDKLASLAASTPTKVKIINLSLDPKGKTQLVGKAANASSAYQFVEVLKSKADLFSEVSLTSVSKKDEGNEVDFTLSVVIN
jgi:hypothetical protein